MRKRTIEFQALLQQGVEEVLGKKHARANCYRLFKYFLLSLIQTVLEDSEKRFSLAGIGVFQIKMRRPKVPPHRRKGSKVLEALKETGVEEIPYWRWDLSLGLREYVTEQLCGKLVAQAVVRKKKDDVERVRLKHKKDDRIPKLETASHVEPAEEL